MTVKKAAIPGLRLAYEDSGPSKGKPVLLVHGWPDSPRTWDKVLPLLHDAGYRTIAPYLRGYGPSTFRDPIFGRKPRRTGQPVAFAQDMIHLADRLKLQSFHYVGHDWGAWTGYALSAVSPQRLRSLTSISVAYEPGQGRFPGLTQARAYWYQWLLCTKPGEASLREDPVAFGRAQWDSWSPRGWYTEKELQAAAKSWQGDDFKAVVLHAYRSRWGQAELDPHYASLQARFGKASMLHTPTLLLHGREDGCALAETTDGAERHFTGPYARVLLDGVGHFPQRENPDATVVPLLAHLREHA